jgi:hypothetical protein
MSKGFDVAKQGFSFISGWSLFGFGRFGMKKQTHVQGV